MVSRRRAELAIAAVLAAGLACGGRRPAPVTPREAALARVTRLRLPLSSNPVDPGRALRCHAECQQQDTPDRYLQCLSQCPGFERTEGIACAPDEVPPLAACFTARQAPVGAEPRAGSVVIAVIGDVSFAVGVSAVCASQTEPCSYAGAGLGP